eukprot:13690036-Alexandrium_andersonii.AAC.1
MLGGRPSAPSCAPIWTRRRPAPSRRSWRTAWSTSSGFLRRGSLAGKRCGEAGRMPGSWRACRQTCFSSGTPRASLT